MFCAFDLETTGLDPQRDQILQIGAVLFTADGILDEFEQIVRHPRYEGGAFALQMNAAILKRLADGHGENLAASLQKLGDWVRRNAPRPYPVGFNVAAFDVAFVKAAGYDLFHHRPIELGSVFPGPSGAPGSSTRAVGDLLGKTVAHDALQDARDAANLYIGRLNGKW